MSATMEEKSAEFERLMKQPGVRKHVQFPLGSMVVNGVFHHYMDSDTDSAWVGFKMGWRAADHKSAPTGEKE